MLKFESNALVCRKMWWYFFGGKECVGVLQRTLDFAMTLNMWDFVGCLHVSTYKFCYLHVYWQPFN